MSTYSKLIAVLLIGSLSYFYVKSGNNGIEKENFSDQNGSEKIHKFYAPDSTFLAEVHVNFVNDSVFNSLFIIKENASLVDTLYSVQGNLFYQNRFLQDSIASLDLLGYQVMEKYNSYIVFRKILTDNSSYNEAWYGVEWEDNERVFSIIKMP